MTPEEFEQWVGSQGAGPPVGSIDCFCGALDMRWRYGRDRNCSADAASEEEGR
jgi:hypothetical protein